jgi:nucleoside-diphosphate-sugar epimerase
MQMSVSTLVSGGTGFVGRFIVENLLAAGHDVTVMGRTAPPDDFFSIPVHFVEGSLDPDRHQSAVFAGVDFFVHAAFDHLAGMYRGGEGDDDAGFRRRNHDGSIALFTAARRADVKRAVFLSSRAVYGVQAPGAILTEETTPYPDTLYGEVKLATEQHLYDMSVGGFCGSSLRVTGVYGPAGSGREHKWAGLFRDYLAGKPIAPRAGTEVHGRDVAAAVRLILEAPTVMVRSQVFNVSDLLVDRHELLSIVRDEMGSLVGPPHPASASLGHPLPGGERRSSPLAPAGQETVEEEARALKVSSPHRGEGGRAKRRPGEGAVRPTSQTPAPLASFPLPPPADHARLNVMASEKIRALGWRPGGAALLREFIRSQMPTAS